MAIKPKKHLNSTSGPDMLICLIQREKISSVKNFPNEEYVDSSPC